MEPLRLKWSRTWPDKERDFSCDSQDGERVGRIYFELGSTNNPASWFWSIHGHYRGRLLSGSGREPDKDSAARSTEQAYFEAVERIDAQM